MRLNTAETSELLRRLDALFARHPHADDSTVVIREQRDARSTQVVGEGHEPC
ncbi:MAG TPA: hypothetical protein VNQ77_11295 [Frankiaceae bacterium]|nr:hypothetical protein [Frankiaceae bacterium]